MAHGGLSRRHFLATTALVSISMLAMEAGVMSPSAGAFDGNFSDSLSDRGFSGRDKDVLLQFARHLYPHKSVADSVYADVVETLSADTAALKSSIRALDGATADQDWLAAASDRRISVMRDLQRTQDFVDSRGQVRVAFYNHPAVWKVIGYEGPSLHLGGYLYRGFDDIDWLPEEE